MRSSAETGDLPEDASWLARIQSVTDVELSHLETRPLLHELLGRVRALLRVDTATVLLREPDSEYLIATAAINLDEEVRQGVRVPLGSGFAGRVAAERQPVVLDRVDETTVVNPLLWQEGITTLLGVPMLSGGELVGVLHVGSFQRRQFGDKDIHLLQLVADRAALVTQARTSKSEQAAARALQHILLPGRLPRLPELEIASRYVPNEHLGVGGDWYDTFLLHAGQLGVVMGDVVGHGLPAAVIMGRLRSTLRAYAMISDDPAAVLELLDREVAHFEPSTMATVAYAIVEPEKSQARFSLAGHPPPVLALPGRSADLVPAMADPPIGSLADQRTRRTHTTELPAGSTLCFYTDGLVERRARSIDTGLERLCASVSNASPERICADVMTAMLSNTVPTDDVALLVLRHQ